MIGQQKKNNWEQGQTLIEFMLVIMVILTLLFVFIQLAWGLAWGHYVHYSTYMAARAYLSATEEQSEQREHAVETLRALIKRPDGIKDLLAPVVSPRDDDKRDIAEGDEPIPGAFIGIHPYTKDKRRTTRIFAWAEGVQYNFEFRLFLLPFARFLTAGEGKSITIGPRGEQTSLPWDGKIALASDAFLGREKTMKECRKFLKKLYDTYGVGGWRQGVERKEFLFDNGC